MDAPIHAYTNNKGKKKKMFFCTYIVNHSTASRVLETLVVFFFLLVPLHPYEGLKLPIMPVYIYPFFVGDSQSLARRLRLCCQPDLAL